MSTIRMVLGLNERDAAWLGIIGLEWVQVLVNSTQIGPKNYSTSDIDI